MRGSIRRVVRLRAMAVVVATATVGSVAVTGAASDARARAASGAATELPAIGPGLGRALSELAPGDRLDVIVSAHRAAGLDALDRFGIPARRLRSAPVAFARLTRDEVARLSVDPAIRSLWPRRRYRLSLQRTTHIVGADRAQRRLGVDGTLPGTTGDGVRVAVLDTGIDATHPDLPWHDKVVRNYEVADPFDTDDANLLVDEPDTDDDGHGTHVASTVAGRDADGGGAHDGVAPGAELYGYSVNVSLTIDSARSLVAFDDVVQKRRAGDPIVAISNSWGGGDGGNHDPDDPLSILVEEAYDSGIAVVFAAGNSGQSDFELNTASRQCVMPWVVCVGATTDPGQLVQFSSRGRPPVETDVTMPDGDEGTVPAGNHDRGAAQALELGLYRPTVSAPGVNVVAACANSMGADCDEPDGYVSMSGTSMATPHVSGVVALVQASRHAARGGLLSAGEVTAVLEGTADPMPGWRTWETGAGQVDAYEAARAVRSARVAVARPNLGAEPRPWGQPELRPCSEDDDAEQPGCQGAVGPASQSTRFLVGEHHVDVPAGTDRLELTLTWDNPEENLYMYAWGPGTDPDGADADRADQESWGLLDGLGPRMESFRKGTIAAPEPGRWTVLVRGRVNALTPYALRAETREAPRPTVTVGRATLDHRGRATLVGASAFPPAAVEGTTREAVAGSALPLSMVGTPRQYWFHGDVPEGDKHGSPGPTFDTTPPQETESPKFQTSGWYGNEDYAGNFLLAYWRAPFAGTIQGDVPLRLYLSGPTVGLGGQITVSLFHVPEGEAGVDEAVLIARDTFSGAGIGPTPTLVEATLRNVAHTVPGDRDLIVQVGSPIEFATGYFQAWYGTASMDAGITLPLLAGASGPSRPEALRTTELTGGKVRLSWNAVPGATRYAVHRSATPGTLGGRIGMVPGSATVFTDARGKTGVPAYYRVVALQGTTVGEPSDVVVGTPVAASRVIEVRAGEGPWETVAAGARTKRWRASVLRSEGPGADPMTFTVRSRDQAGASTLSAIRFGP